MHSHGCLSVCSYVRLSICVRVKFKEAQDEDDAAADDDDDKEMQHPIQQTILHFARYLT